MFRFFDYVYYKACNFYLRENPDSVGLSGLIIIALMQVLNLLTCFFLMSIILGRKFHINKLLLIALCILLLVVNGIRYNKLTYAILKDKWDNEEENKKIKGQLLVLLYISGSAIMCVGLAIYVGSKNW